MGKLKQINQEIQAVKDLPNEEVTNYLFVRALKDVIKYMPKNLRIDVPDLLTAESLIRNKVVPNASKKVVENIVSALYDMNVCKRVETAIEIERAVSK